MSRKSYSVEKLFQHKENIETNGVAGAINFYDEMYSNGYNYAGWANGVAKGNTTTGKSATDFLVKTAQQGVGGIRPKTLTTSDLNSIKESMALGYINTLIKNAKDTGGYTNQDVTYKQTRSFHKKAFEENGLSIENWTLETPMSIMKELHGEQTVENLWATIRESGGEDTKGITQSGILYLLMDRVARNEITDNTSLEKKELIEKARKWLDVVGSPFSKKNIKNFCESIWDELFGQSTPLGASKQSKLMAVSVAPSFNYTNAKRTSIGGFTLVQTLDNATGSANKTTFNGQPAYLLDQTTQATCTGDEAGWAGGVKSGTVGKEVKPTSGSSSILVEGKQLVREGDNCTMNNGNTTGKYIRA